jgi:hypothetical protein
MKRRALNASMIAALIFTVRGGPIWAAIVPLIKDPSGIKPKKVSV